ncbi:MAG: FliM/FliN family flagellar motor switch protein [Endozoicomonadaceae bacterium]|nr:FliM/FliN family flagellar motor switch protein [Endozoicomonadaceae bacterium]
MKTSKSMEALKQLRNINSPRTKVQSESDFSDIKHFDLTNPDYKILDMQPMLELLYRRFAQQLRFSLYNLFRHKAEVTFHSVKSMKFGTYSLETKEAASLHAFKVTTLKFNGFVKIDHSMISALIDLFFGGSGDASATQEEAREMSPTEKRMLHRFLEAVLENLQEVWETILPFKIRELDTSTTPVSHFFYNDSELIIVSRFTVVISDIEGHIEIVLPYYALEPIREKINSHNNTTQDPQWKTTLQRNIMMASVNMSATLCQVPLSLKEVLELQTGDVIKAEIPKQIIVKIAGVPCLQASVCTIDNNMALKIIKTIKQKENREQTEEKEQKKKKESK